MKKSKTTQLILSEEVKAFAAGSKTTEGVLDKKSGITPSKTLALEQALLDRKNELSKIIIIMPSHLINIDLGVKGTFVSSERSVRL